MTAGGIAVAYFALALLAVACMTAHGGGHAESHDHSRQPIHSLLCVWACQAGTPDYLPVASSLPPTKLLALAVAILSSPLFLEPVFRQASSRAPPR